MIVAYNSKYVFSYKYLHFFDFLQIATSCIITRNVCSTRLSCTKKANTRTFFFNFVRNLFDFYIHIGRVK